MSMERKPITIIDVCILISYVILRNCAFLVVDNNSNVNHLQLVFYYYEPRSIRLVY